MSTYIIAARKPDNPPVDGECITMKDFLRRIASEESIPADVVYIDVAILHESEYRQLQAVDSLQDSAVRFYRTHGTIPDFIEAEVEDWSASKPDIRAKLSRAMHLLFFDRRYLYFVVVMIAGLVLMEVTYALYHSYVSNNHPALLIVTAPIALVALFFFIAMCYGAIGILVRLIYGFAAHMAGECPLCGKLGTTKTSTQTMGTQSISIKKELQRKNSRGEVIGTDEQYIPGTRTFYRTWYRCKQCGREFHRDTFSDHAHV